MRWQDARMSDMSFPRIQPEIGKRVTSRLRLRLPARMKTTAQTWGAELLDLSYFGARIACEEPPQPGQDIVLEWGDHDAFGMIVWANLRTCGVRFYDALGPDVLLSTRDRGDVEIAPTTRERARIEARDFVQGRIRR